MQFDLEELKASEQSLCSKSRAVRLFSPILSQDRLFTVRVTGKRCYPIMVIQALAGIFGIYLAT